MTNMEKLKCKKLIEEANVSLDISDTYWRKYEKMKETENKIDAQIAMRKASYHRGYAEGIYQALVVIGYFDESMEELTERI